MAGESVSQDVGELAFRQLEGALFGQALKRLATLSKQPALILGHALVKFRINRYRSDMSTDLGELAFRSLERCIASTTAKASNLPDHPNLTFEQTLDDLPGNAVRSSG